MKYVYLVDGRTVHDIQPGKSKDFPGISIKERFSADYLAHCVEVRDSIEVESGWLYDSETGGFSVPPEPEPLETDIINTETLEAQGKTSMPTVADDLMRMVIEQEYSIALLTIGMEV